jgi:general secretion pathway protein B
MSYVLDALRRAEAERARGAVPGLNAQPLAAPAAAPPPRGPVPWPLLSGVGIVVLALGTGVAWWTARPTGGSGPVAQAPTLAPAAPAPVAPAPIAAAVPTAPAPAASVPPPVVAAPAAPAPAAPAALPAAPPVKPAPAPVVQAQAPAAQPRAPATASATASLQAKSASAAPRRAPEPTQAPAPPQAVSERIPPLAELPDALRRDLPALRFGGAMDSPQPAARMLIINGQVFREGDALAPGLTLQTIRLRSAVFEFRGQRFEAAY